MKQTLRTLVLNFKEAGVVDLPRIEKVRDVTFWNPIGAGTYNTALITVNGVTLELLPGDPMLSFGGYDFIERSDVIQVDFSGAGDNNLIVFANKLIDG